MDTKINPFDRNMVTSSSQILTATHSGGPVAPGIARRRMIVAVASVVLVILGCIPATSTWVIDILGIVAPIAMLFGMLRCRLQYRWPWIAIAFGMVLFVLGQLEKARLTTTGYLQIGRSFLPGLFTLSGYVALIFGVIGVVMIRSRGEKNRFGVLCDGIIGGLATLATTWVFLVEPKASGLHASGSILVLVMAFPSASAYLLIVTYQIAFVSGNRRSEAERYFLFAMIFLFVSEIANLLAEAHYLSPASLIVSLPSVIAYAGAIAAVLDPSMRLITTPQPRESAHWSPMRVALVALGLSTPALLLLKVQHESTASLIGLTITVFLLSGVAILQIVRALYDVERSESKLKYQAMHDALTGLPNRRFMERHLEQTLSHLTGGQESVGVLFLDLDRFKLINDTLGHAHGDALLIQVARRLQANVRPNDLVTRIGGDEFVIVLGEAISVDKAREFANRLRRSLNAPFVVSGIEFVVSASIGVAFAGRGDRADVVEHLIRDADTAMYQAKEGGRDSVAVYEDSMRAEVNERVELERDLRHAARRGELFLVYQPIVAMSDQQILGMEALVRWSHPTLGVLLPYRFIHLAEETELINEIGAWVLDEALRQLALCRKMPNMNHLTVSVNLSVNQLRDGLLVQRVGRMLATHGLPASALCLELTESEIMKDPESAIEILVSLRRLGITLAVDDFGTEYSSLSYLQRLPFDVLKIDRSFVEPLHEGNTASESLVAAIVAMANALGIRTVVEGVETMDQARRLEQIGCDVAQGYMYARPARADQLDGVLQLLSTRKRNEDLLQLTDGAPVVALG
jgi:diguanylate cyclase (GGDEF)-like protein